MGSSTVIQGCQNEDGSFPPRKTRLQTTQCFKLLISTVRNIIRKWKISGTVEVKARSGRLRICSDRMVRDLVKNGQKNPHITAKDLKKKSSRHRSSCTWDNNIMFWTTKTYMAELPKRRLPNNLDTKLSIWSLQKKILRRLKHFGTKTFWPSPKKVSIG